ncbi:ATP-binding protein [Merismopedia glauca]|uniref:histidine kinase n=1 Tax=Merismopedia glauca CCAP 1448/3 TaxID=1296344 RepID=A0A2T1C3B1_9CYAN|nr:ATP-binding protein [Merismopedia glauca]PSB02752.1 cyanobacterial phytochrome A [Merismopedia glauca CCAP 1448/3]
MTELRVNLTNCDQEPIHIPGLIQPHGVLLVLKELKLEIIQVSHNTSELLGHQPQELLGKPLSDLLDAKQIAAIWQCLSVEFESINPLNISIKGQTKPLRFDGIVYRWDSAIVLELEPKKARQKTDFFDFYQRVRGTITKIQKAPTLLEMCQIVVKEVRRITEFERVMVYRFDTEGAGSIIAEDKPDGATPYLDLHYPASDIPQQARQLYTLNWLRLIPDVNYQPVELIPANNPATDRPLDMSLSVLRSASPIHIEYLQNMGVTASMSISLIQDRKLWGLIACHHSSPKYVPYGVRTACEFIGQVMSLELATKEANEDLDYKVRLQSLLTKFVESLSQFESFLDGIVQLESNLLDLVSASGAVVCLGEGKAKRCIHIGETPPEAALPALLDWLKHEIQLNNLFHTRSLSQVYPPAEEFKGIASGLLALAISQVHQNYILWFRPEVMQTIKWGGNPNKAVEALEDGSLQLHPRKSFTLWQETVNGYALPWKTCEIEAVAELRSLLVGVILRQADELAAVNIELKRSNDELDSFAYIASHDLKEPLRGIHNYANFLMEDYAEVLDEDGIRKLQTLVRLTQRLENLINSLLHFSRLGRTELSWQTVNLNALVQQAIATLKMSQQHSSVQFRLPRPLPTIKGDRTQLNELFTNLLSNASKYNNSPEKWVEIGFIDNSARKAPATPYSQLPTPYTFYVRDNGISIPQEHLDKIFQIFRRLHGRDEYGGGTGVGLTIARKIVERHGGEIWVESMANQGSTFYFTLPREAMDD